MRVKVRTLVTILAILCLLTSCNNESSEVSQPPAEEEKAAASQIAQQSDAVEPISDSETFEGEISLDFSYGTRKGKYSGEVNSDGVPNGFGTFSTKNNDGEAWTCEGEWENGHMIQGSTTWESGLSYTGEYTNDLENGHGVLIYGNGEKYEGEFVESLPCGEGTFYYADGAYFKGNFEDNLNATGFYYDVDGAEHSAKFEDGVLQLDDPGGTSTDSHLGLSPAELAEFITDNLPDSSPYAMEYDGSKFKVDPIVKTKFSSKIR